MKKKIVFSLSIFVLVLSIVLNIVLLTEGVFHGVYTNKQPDYIEKITFYNNTFSYESEVESEISRTDYGFYQYIPKSKDNSAQKNVLVLYSAKYESSETIYTRNSVFSFTLELNNQKITYVCKGAIALQIFYALLIAASATTIILFIKKQRQHVKSKKDGE